MRVLVTGAQGFIGSQIALVLLKAGHEVVCGVRRPIRSGPLAGLESIVCDFACDVDPATWLARLDNIDAVVNCAGILREAGKQRFDAVHRAAPCALFDACVEAGVAKVIQISALGEADDTAFIRSKHAADAYLATLALAWTVLRPSVVYTPAGSYGGTSLLRALAALPGVLLLPGSGQQRIQPIQGDDLAMAVVRALETDNIRGEILEVVGPDSVTFETYLCTLRRWLGLAEARVIRIPLALIKPVAWLGEHIGRGPLGLTMYRMLQRGNSGASDAIERFVRKAGFRPCSLAEALRRQPSYVQDRWQARLYFLRPLLRLSLALLWLVSGWIGFTTPLQQSQDLLTTAGVAPSVVAPLVYFGSGVDILLGLALLMRYRVALTGLLMCVSLLVYTVFLGIMLPALWLEPFGGLIKNIPLLIAVWVMMAVDDVR